MVEYTLNLDLIFASLADPTRRDILQRVSGNELTVGAIAKHYRLTFAAVSKHLKVLEQAHLILKRRRGKEQLVTLAPQALADAMAYLKWYQRFVKIQYDSLDKYLKKEK